MKLISDGSNGRIMADLRRMGKVPPKDGRSCSTCEKGTSCEWCDKVAFHKENGYWKE